MALPVWGNLEKSQIDPEKLEEAIARLIQAHEDDSDAHLEVGESLYSHKASEIIDHIISSIVADKTSNAQHVIRSNFFEASDYDTKPAGLTVKPYWCTFSISGSDITKTLETAIPPFDRNFVYSKDLLWGVGFIASHGSNRTYYFHLYNEGPVEGESYIGFELRHLELWGVTKGVEGFNEVKLCDVTPTWTYMVRIICNSVTQKVEYYFGNDKVGELDIPEFEESTDLHMRFRASTVDPANYALLTLRNLVISADV